MIATVCKKTGTAVLVFECENCQERDTCQTLDSIKKKASKNDEAITGNVKNHLEEIVKKAVKEHEKMGDRKQRCDFCEFCKHIKTIRESCCDVGLYECQNPESKKYRTKMDEFHVWMKSCECFTSRA